MPLPGDCYTRKSVSFWFIDVQLTMDAAFVSYKLSNCAHSLETKVTIVQKKKRNSKYIEIMDGTE